MRIQRTLLAAAAICCASGTSHAVEGSSAAGPIGGTDIRTAQLPPPGVYGGLVGVYAEAHQFFDGAGNLVAAFSALDLRRNRIGAFAVYVPDFRLLGGSVAIAAFVPGGTECGRLFDITPSRCIAGFGDPYVEIGWSRFYGRIRPSRYPGALPIAEGLTVAHGFGAVIPIGRYDAVDAVTQGLTIGNNVWVLAPTVAVTYMTPPLLGEGTEFSARLYWNNYLTNPATRYSTGALINIDFAVTERIGRIQFGVAGFYAFQVADDKLFGIPIAPDGRRVKSLFVGGVLAYDMPEYGAFMKIKALTSVLERNSVKSPGVAITLAKKL